MKTISAQKLEEKLNKNESLNLIDVREDEEVAAGKIPGAAHIPLGSLEARIDELDQSKGYVMICRSGGRSGRAAQFLEQNGFDVTNMDGGMLDWNGPTE
ncbi:Rhodanese-related sulfurtransferase [Halobacillus alkaliphilus]|uniref:Rhodanese-related sulfurtransferase n=1 Tax=Halobacillus alkaliphilus TaxID=396056 RepID=A0A1I2RZZ0_9BACI|nr:rhodanese-like domain-containing protein [Halobacillus alkaliphilus]SFG44187.1 Rhodanese-related sulfurtransferase [Halobacillus alkaliphilus]